MKGTYYTISRIPTGTNRVPKAAAGALLGTALQLGQTLGEMMPDTVVGDGLKGVLNPMDALGRSVDNFSKGKIGRGLLSLTPIGGFLDSRDRRAEEAKAEAEAKVKANTEFMNRRRISDTEEAASTAVGTNMTTLYAKGGSITSMDKVANVANRSSNAPLNFYGENNGSPYNSVSGVPISKNAQLITNPQGNTAGSHETGQNIPVVANGKTQAITEPGEVLVNNPDGTATVMSKRLGFAQEYQKVEETLKQLFGTLNATKDTFQKNAIRRNIAALELKKVELQRQQEILAEEEQLSGQQEEAVPVGSLGLALDDDPFKKSRMVWHQGKLVPASSIQNYEYSPNTKSSNISNPAQQPFGEVSVYDPTTPGMTRTGITRGGVPSVVAPTTPASTTPTTTRPKTTKATSAPAVSTPVVSITKPTIPLTDSYTPIDYSNIDASGKKPIATTGNSTSTIKVDGAPVDNSVASGKSKSDKLSNVLDVANTIASGALPIVANIKNKAIMDKMSKKLNEFQPELLKVNRNVDKIDVTDQINAVNNVYAGNTRVSRSVSNPLVASAIMSEAGANRISNLNQVYGEANRTNLSIKQNADRMSNYAAAQNNQMANAANQAKLEGELGRLGAEINLNNQTVANIYSQIQEKNMMDLDMDKLSLALKYVDQYGIVDRNYADYDWVKKAREQYGLDIPIK